ncbi:MAG: glycosyltransferase [Syntrophobacteraceae bacterium]
MSHAMPNEPRGALKILILTDLFPNHAEKIKGIFNLFRASALREAGCEVKIIAPVGITPPARFFFPVPRLASAFGHMKSKLRVAPREVIDGFEVLHPKWFWLPRKLFWRYELELLHWSAGKIVTKTLRDFHPDVVLTSWLHPFGTYAKYMKRISDVPVIAIAEGDDILINPYKYTMWDKIADYIAEYIDIVVCISNSMYNAESATNIERRIVIVNTYNHRVFYLKPAHSYRNRGINILSVGSLDNVKGHDILLKAMLKLSISFKLTMVGNGPLLGEYLHFIHTNGMSDRITIIQEVENQYLGEYIRKSNLFCMPSRSEGFGLACLEALACGVPVVGSNVGGLSEMILEGFNGYLFEPEDADALANKLVMASRKDWDGEKIATWAKEHYSVNRWTGEMLSLIKWEIDKNSRNRHPLTEPRIGMGGTGGESPRALP